MCKPRGKNKLIQNITITSTFVQSMLPRERCWRGLGLYEGLRFTDSINSGAALG
jgi:hypothetical protein